MTIGSFLLVPYFKKECKYTEKVRVEANEEPGFSDPGIPVVPFIGLEAAREQGTVNEKRATKGRSLHGPCFRDSKML